MLGSDVLPQPSQMNWTTPQDLKVDIIYTSDYIKVAIASNLFHTIDLFILCWLG